MSTARQPDGHRGDFQPAMQRRLAQLHAAMGGAVDTTDDALPAPATQAPGRASASTRAVPTKRVSSLPLLSLGGLLALGITAAILSRSEGTRSATAASVPSPALATATVPALPLAEMPAAPAPAASPPEDKAIRDTLERWRLDWSQRDVPAYLAHYSTRFEPAGGISRTAWAAQRRQALLKRPAIRVEVADLRIEHPSKLEARVHFRQTYLSGRYQENDQAKTLHLLHEDGGWRIVGEWQGASLAEAARLH